MVLTMKMFLLQTTCYETAIQLAKRFNLKEEDYSVGFQSRLGRGWIEPFSDEIITDLAKKVQKIISLFTAFVAMTVWKQLLKLGMNTKNYLKNMVGKVQLVESLNSSDTFVHGLKEMILKRGI